VVNGIVYGDTQELHAWNESLIGGQWQGWMQLTPPALLTKSKNLFLIIIAISFAIRISLPKTIGYGNYELLTRHCVLAVPLPLYFPGGLA
jgi:hypothetical protein